MWDAQGEVRLNDDHPTNSFERRHSWGSSKHAMLAVGGLIHSVIALICCIYDEGTAAPIEMVDDVENGEWYAIEEIRHCNLNQVTRP